MANHQDPRLHCMKNNDSHKKKNFALMQLKKNHMVHYHHVPMVQANFHITHVIEFY